MKILILILALHTPDQLIVLEGGKTTSSTSRTIIVATPEEAAMTVWSADRGGKPMNSYYTGKLFQVDLEVNKVEEVKLPEVKIETK